MIRNLVNVKIIKSGKYKEFMMTRTMTVHREFLPFEFDSRFESGNLAVSIKKPAEEVEASLQSEYDLVLSNDVNTRGHT